MKSKLEATAFTGADQKFANQIVDKLQRTLQQIEQIEKILAKERRDENEFTIDVEVLLHNILETIRDNLNFYNGLVYVHDTINSLLRCEALFGPCSSRVERRALKYHIKTNALATWAFNRGCPVVAQATDRRVNKAGVERLGITGQLFVHPLIHNKIKVGVLVLWDYAGSEHPNKALGRLERYSNIAATAIALRASKRANEAFFHNIIDTLPACVFRKDRTERFTYANEAFRKDVRASLGKIVGVTDFKFYPSPIARAYQRDDRRVIATGESVSKIEEHYQYLGSPLRYVHVVKGPIWNSRGEIKGVQGVFVDVTANKLKEALFEKTKDIIFSHDEKGTITYVNQAGQKLLGIDARKKEKVNILQLLGFEERRDMKALIRAAAAAARKRAARSQRSSQNLLGEAPRRVLQIRSLNGMKRKVEYSSTAVLLPDDNVIFHGIGRDLTLQEQLTGR